MFKIVLVGRPNVGKSSLFNRLVRSDKAIVNNQPGVTRDRKYGQGSLVDLKFTLVDTAGISDSFKANTKDDSKTQTLLAIDESDIIILVIDGRVGVLPVEEIFAKSLIKTNKSVIILVNKSEGSAGLAGLSDSASLGFDNVIPFSAEHGDGLSDLYDCLKEKMEFEKNKIYENKDLNTNKKKSSMRIGIIGRPNTGKSTLINNIIDQKRLVTGVQAGLTRDSIEVLWNYKNEQVSIIDTAGLRKKSKVINILEKDMVNDTLRTIKFSDICILLIDVSKSIDKQDLNIARMIIGEGRGLIIGANMWDKIIDKNVIKEEIFYQLKRSLSQIKNIPIVFISGLHRQGLEELFEEVIDIKRRLSIRISTGKLNKWLIPVIENNPPPLYKGKKNNIRYITQVNVRPPTFAVFMSSPDNLPISYKRFFASSLMKDFDLSGLPLRVMYRKGNNPYIGQ
jgi:GTP-binding protein